MSSLHLKLDGHSPCFAVGRVGRVAGDGLSLCYYEWNHTAVAAPPIVLLHGITESARSWEAVVAHLGAERRAIAFDARGHGESDWSRDEAYAPDHHFADLAVALDKLSIGRCTLVGYSMGGAVATICAAAMPERVLHLVIVDAYPDPRLSAGSRRIARLIARAYEHRVSALPSGFDPAIARRMHDDLAADVAKRLDLWPFWDALCVPVTVVRGEHSDVLTEDLAVEMLARQPRASLTTIRDVAHQIPSLRPAALAQAILTQPR